MSNADMRPTRSIYLAVLAKGVPSPLAKESDEEAEKKAEEAKDAATAKPAGETPADKPAAPAPPVKVVVDFDGIAQRILALPPKPATLPLEHAAAVPISAFAALQALRDTGQVQPGQRVLIIGASGGVGTLRTRAEPAPRRASSASTCRSARRTRSSTRPTRSGSPATASASWCGSRTRGPYRTWPTRWT